jgi:Uma2 family endonuclease
MIATVSSMPWTFAELHQRLGGIPLERIRMNPPPGTATEEDLLRAPKPTCELIDGVLVEKPMGNPESMVGLYVGSLLLNHVMAKDLGTVLGEEGYFRLRSGLLRAPDASFTPWTAFPHHDVPREAYWSVAPALIVEVLSPKNTRAEINRKLEEFFAVGTQLAWVINQRTRSAKVHTTSKHFEELDESGTLTGGKVLPG